MRAGPRTSIVRSVAYDLSHLTCDVSLHGGRRQRCVQVVLRAAVGIKADCGERRGTPESYAPEGSALLPRCVGATAASSAPIAAPELLN
jgi:hypothetical protein